MSADSATKPAPVKKAPSRLGRYLPLLIVIMGVPAGAWFGMDYWKERQLRMEQAAKEEAEKSKSSLKLPGRMPVPVLPNVLQILPKTKLMFAEYPRIVATNSTSTNPESLVVQLADSRRTHHLAAQIFVAGDDTDHLVLKINENQPAFYESFASFFSGKTLNEVQSPGFRKQMRTELLRIAQGMLGSNVVQEVIISEMIFK